MIYQAVLKKWQQRQANIAIIGLGYVGLPLALSFANKNIKVTGIDNDQNKINDINQGKSYLHHIPNENINQAIKQGFSATNDYKSITQTDAIILCLPTPLSTSLEPDLSHIHNALKNILPHLQNGQVIALESTTYPGTTEEEIAPILQQQKWIIGENIFLVYSPEREDPGNKQYSTANIPKIIGGYTQNCLNIGTAMYKCAIANMIPVNNTKTAEMVKLLENIYRSVNIGLANEMKQVSDAMQIDIFEVIQAANSKPFGFNAFYPGPGVGGHCIPIDPFYLTWKAKAYGLHTRFVELAGEINKSMPEYVIRKLSEALNLRKKSINGSNILILGVSYKKNIADLRESPALKIIELLQLSHAKISYSDTFVKNLPSHNLKHSELNIKTIKQADAIIIVSDHDYFNYDEIAQHARLIVDCKGRFSSQAENVIRS